MLPTVEAAARVGRREGWRWSWSRPRIARAAPTPLRLPQAPVPPLHPADTALAILLCMYLDPEDAIQVGSGVGVVEWGGGGHVNPSCFPGVWSCAWPGKLG